MIKLLILTFALILSTECAAIAQSWKKIGNMPEVVNSGYFFDDSTGFVGTGHTTIPIPLSIHRTTDGGSSWTVCSTPSPASGSVSSFFFRDRLVGFASILVAGGPNVNRLWETNDGGLTWVDKPTMGTGTATCVYGTAKALFLTDLFSRGAVSFDGGLTFTASLPSLSLGLAFLDDNNGIATNFNQPWQRTTDGGRSWKAVNNANESWSLLPIIGTSSYLSASETNYLSVGNVTVIRRSDDMGQNWTDVDTFRFQTTGDIKGLNGSVYIQTCNQTPSSTGILKSTDLGKTWTDIGGPQNWFDSRFVLTSNFCGDEVIFAFDGSGGVYRFDKSSRGTIALTIASTTQSLGSDTSVVAGSIFRGLIIARSPNQDTTLVNSLEFTLQVDPQILSYIRCQPGLGWTIKDSSTQSDGKIWFSLVATKPTKFAPNFCLLELDYLVTLGLADYSPMLITGLLINSQVPRLGTCSFAEANIHLLLKCGDSTIRGLMRHEPLILSSIFPDPFVTSQDGSLRIQIASPIKDRLMISVINDHGIEVQAPLSQEVINGLNQLMFPLHRLAAGLYFARIVSLEGIFEKKFLVVN